VRVTIHAYDVFGVAAFGGRYRVDAGAVDCPKAFKYTARKVLLPTVSRDALDRPAVGSRSKNASPFVVRAYTRSVVVERELYKGDDGFVHRARQSGRPGYLSASREEPNVR
jgi:hypothetical protein